MTRLVLIRHGATDFNDQGRMQGRSDEPLNEAGRAAVSGWRVPPEFADAVWLTSPLIRARETARLLGAARAVIEPRLIEMDWGRWEGRRLDDLRAEHGAAMADNEARGLDFQPEGGESPRQVQARITPWLAEVGLRGRPTTLAVTHKGVIRAAIALATGWDMTGKPPAKLLRAAAHVFDVTTQGGITVICLDLPLDGGDAP